MSSKGLCSYKDEVTELTNLLNSENQRDSDKYKNLIQQVILYMTKGIDMTPLFPTIVKAAATRDIVQKKLCYLYLCNCASSHPDLALLTVNTLKRDAEDVNPMIRGLALRSMGSLRLDSLVEYTKDAMIKGLEDCSPYVRRAAVIGCLQLYQLDPKEMEESVDIVKKLYEKLTDKDTKVRTNCQLALMEIFSGELTVESPMAKFLLKRLKTYDEWGQQFVLDLLMLYIPQEEDEVYDILNYIDDCLKHTNSSVVLGAVRLFVHLTTGNMQLRNHVFERIKVPLLTALLSKGPEIVYTILCHIDIILTKAPTVFEHNFSSFFCRENDPLYLKVKKLEVLCKLVTESNGKQIINELSYHAKRTDTSFHSITNIGMVALLHPELAYMCIEKLFSFLSLKDSDKTSHVLTAFRDLVIKYDKCSVLLANLGEYLKVDLLSDGKASVVWMLGEFGEDIPESPYLLESLIDNINEETSPSVKLELLSASVKLFFKRPPECQEMLGHLLEYCIEKEYHIDVRDRSLLYYRLLKSDVKKAKEVICCPRSSQFIDNTNVTLIHSKETLFKEFNTLAIIYGQPSSSFITDEKLDFDKRPNENTGEANELPAPNDQENLNESQPAEQTATDEGSSTSLKLTEKPDLSPQTFESLWRKLAETESYEVDLGSLPNLGEFQNLLASQRIYTMASTPPDSKQARYFFYAKADSFILCEVTLDTLTNVLKSTIKMENPSHIHSFIELFQNCLLS